MVLSRIAKGGDCSDICDLMLGTYVKLELTNPLKKCTLLVTACYDNSEFSEVVTLKSPGGVFAV